MARKAPLFINGKFISAGPTAVHRVALELVKALAPLISDRELCLLVPPGLAQLAHGPGIQTHPVGGLKGNAWEQISLPWHARGGVLLNLCNRSPLVLRNGLTLLHDAQAFTAPRSYAFAGRLAGQWQARAAGRRQLGLLTVSDFAKSELV
ncbi:glycosyltransferase family 1 protein, partial [Ancylobacter polymorphus]